MAHFMMDKCILGFPENFRIEKRILIHPTINVSTQTNKQTSNPTNKKDSNNFDKTGEKIHIAKKEERKKKTLSSFVLLAFREFTHFS